MDDVRKPIKWMGGSKAVLASFPKAVIQEAGYQLDRVQLGLQPDDFKPMKQLGKGVRGIEEVRIQDVGSSGIYRIMYVARFEDAIYVLHCFSKKTQKTTQRDKDMTIKRYKAMIEERSQI